MEDVKKVLREELLLCQQKRIKDWSTIKTSLKDALRDYIFAKTKRNPMILPIIMPIKKALFWRILSWSSVLILISS